MSQDPSVKPWETPRPGLWPAPRKSRRDKIREEIAANRRGEHLVPTWVLAVALGLMIAAVAALVIYANRG